MRMVYVFGEPMLVDMVCGKIVVIRFVGAPGSQSIIMKVWN